MNTRLSPRTLRGLYAVTPDSADTEKLARDVAAAIAGGARCVQYRNKTASAALRREQALRLREVCRACGAALIINDHVDLARECEADGVHIGVDDVPLADTRSALPDALIGVSCYNSLERARAARDAGADYVAFGSFFASQVKPGAVRATVSLLETARREIELPLVAIGGITHANGGTLVAAGADALAVISDIFGAPDVQAAAARFQPLFKR